MFGFEQRVYRTDTIARNYIRFEVTITSDYLYCVVRKIIFMQNAGLRFVLCTYYARRRQNVSLRYRIENIADNVIFITKIQSTKISEYNKD